MTDAQRYLFGNKLAHDERVQSEYSHLVGTGSYVEFAKLLAEMLTNEVHFKTFYPSCLSMDLSKKGISYVLSIS